MGGGGRVSREREEFNDEEVLEWFRQKPRRGAVHVYDQDDEFDEERTYHQD